MTCSGCPTPSRAQAHCPSCHRTFSGVWGFDKHRSRGACLDPGELGFQLRGAVWRRPASERQPWHASPDASPDAQDRKNGGDELLS
jgi:hypothetical protein